MENSYDDIDSFIRDWQDDPERIKEGFVYFKNLVESMDSTLFEFIQRQGLTYSLRVKHKEQQEKPLFVLIDVIEAEPRWLSICFYAELITDPEELGDFVPGGLLGEDAYCYDMEEYNSEMVGYLEARIQEAYVNAAK